MVQKIVVISYERYAVSKSQQRDKSGESSRDNDNLVCFFMIPNSINHNQRADSQIPAWIKKTNTK